MRGIKLLDGNLAKNGHIFVWYQLPTSKCISMADTKKEVSKKSWFID